MAAPIFIGDEVSAAGYRLAGVRIRTPGPIEVLEVITWACRQSPLVMITTEYAAMLSASDQDHLLSQLTPALVVVPDIRSKTAEGELARRMRAQLGVLE